MTKEEAKEIFLNRGFINGLFDGDKWRQSIVVISEWLKQEPCEDTISRQAVLEYIKESEADLCHEPENESVRQDIKEFPPVNLQQDTVHFDFELFEEGLQCLPKDIVKVLEKIKDEIWRERIGYPPSADHYKAIMKCLQIIDKYIAESEGMDADNN